MARWDLARASFDCGKCGGCVGQGEAFRVSKVPRKNGYCEDCSIAIDGEVAPAHIQGRDFLTRLRDDIAQHAPANTEPVFARFDGAQVGEQLRANITALRQGKPQPRVDVSARQPSIEPRNPRYRRRHGVVEAIRATTQHDWRARATGERDE